MKFLKKLSMIMFVGWSILLVLILTFGTKVAALISSNVSQQIYEEKNRLEDIILPDVEYLIEKAYNPAISIVPDTHPTEDLIYTSLTPEIFEIVENNHIKGKRLETDRNVGKLLITSKKYPDFRKEFDLTFIKTYPSSFDFYLCDSEHLLQDNNNVYIDTPFFVCANLKSNHEGITENKMSFIYDENYFDVIKNSYGDLELKPKYMDYQIGDDFEPVNTVVKLVVNDKVVASKEITINPILHAESFDKSMFVVYPSNRVEMDQDVFVKQSFYLELYESNNKLRTPFTISVDDASLVKVNDDGELTFLKRGIVNITVALKNGFSKTYQVKIRESVVPPIVSSAAFNEKGEIVIKLETATSVLISFPSHASYTEYTYTLDSVVSKPEYNEENKIYIAGTKVGTYNLIIHVDDGTEAPITVTYKINVIPNENSYTEINKEFSLVLAKILGHMSFFVLQAILGIFMISFYKRKQSWINGLLLLLVGLVTAWISEFVQFFIPGRNCSIEDVFIDILGYCIGLLIGTFIRMLIRLCKLIFKPKSGEQS